MQIDEVVWQIINRQNCSFKIPTATQTFCRNEYNVSGKCNRSSCPLANSQYATVMQEKGVCYLYIKTIERAHTPKDMWEKIKLEKNYEMALNQIDEHLAYWPKFLIHKNKQRLTKLRQMLIRIRKLKLKGYKEVVPVQQKVERREKIREKKAEVAANVEDVIEQELLDRLQSGVYQDLYANLNPKAFKKVTDKLQVEQEEEEEDELDEEELDSAEYIYDPNEQSDENDDSEDFGSYGEEEDEDNTTSNKRKGVDLDNDSEQEEENPGKKNRSKPSKKQKKGRKILNYEQEQETQQPQELQELDM